MGVRIVVRGGTELRSSAEVVYEFDQQRIVIGRGAGADVRIPQRTVSETHATLRLEGTTWVVQDEGSTNGTRVNGTRVVAGRPKSLRSGDTLELGGFVLAFSTGVAVSESTSADRTAALARRLVREMLDPSGTGASPPKLTVLAGPQAGKVLEVPPPPARLVIGRAESCDLQLTDADASREHVEVLRDLDGVLVRDLGSKNGIIVNEKPTRERRLRDRDELLIGSTPLSFEEPADAAIRALEKEPDQSIPLTRVGEPATASATESATATATESATATAAATESATDSATATATESVAAPSTPPLVDRRKPQKKSSGLGADVVIYILAAAVLLASLAGLVFLLRAE